MKKYSDLSKICEHKDSTFIENDIISLINDKIKVKINGNLDKYLSEDIEIHGVEKLAEAIDLYVNNKILESNKFILESVKYKGLDMTERLMENERPFEIKKHRIRIKNLLKEEDYKKSAEYQANLIKNGDKAYQRGITAGQMVADYPKDRKKLNEIKDIFIFRAKQLGIKL